VSLGLVGEGRELARWVRERWVRENLGERLGEGQLAALLRTIEDDYGRFADVASVVEEVAEQIFRGGVQAATYRPFAAWGIDSFSFELMYRVERGIYMEGVSGFLDIDFSLYYKAPRGRLARYEGEIILERASSGGRGDALRLLDLLLKELAGILDHPGIGRLRRLRHGVVRLYRNIRTLGED
jgi:hypothetical protein